MNRASAIDIGSNSILLTIVEKDKPLKVLFDEAYVVGLARGLGNQGVISEDSLQRALTVLAKCKETIQKYDVENLKVVGTEAFRKAKNGPQVKQKIEEVLACPLEIITGNREAELSFLGVQNEFKDSAASKIVFDIGGASTELCLGSESGINQLESLKIGSVLLTEKFGLMNAQQSDTSYKDALTFVKNIIQASGWEPFQAKSLGIGVAGTITNLLSIEKELKEYSRDAVHGKSISLKKMEYWLKEILHKTVEERKKIVGMHPDRADVFGGGLVIAVALTTYFGWKEIYCMDSGVRYGLLYEMFNL